MLAASRVARRCASVNQQGTEITQSGEGDLLCASAVPRRLTVVLTRLLSVWKWASRTRYDFWRGYNDIEYIVEE